MTLERWFRLLLHAFPAEWRARHGDDIIATLLDRSSPGRRPALGDSVNLVASGLQCRARRHAAALRIAAAVTATAAAAGVILSRLTPSMISTAGSLTTLWLIYIGVALSPGVNFALIAQTATRQARKDAMCVAAGVTTATAVWMTASLIGLITLAEEAGGVFSVIRIGGGLYLIWLGAKKFTQRNAATAGTPVATRSRSQARNFATGFATNMGNPKAVLFFGSLFATALPADASTGLRVAGALLILATSIAIHTGLAALLSVSTVRDTFERVRRLADPLFGAVLIAFGVRLLRTEP